MPIKRYDLAVYIGRFQPPHSGHHYVMKNAATIADRVLVLIGSSTASRSVRNPFTLQERIHMIGHMTAGLGSTLTCRGIADSAYNFHDWLIRVKNEAYKLARDEGVAAPRIVLAGAFKDDTSFYLKYFPEWELSAVPVYKDLSSSAIRDALYSESRSIEGQTVPEGEEIFLRDNLDESVRACLADWKKTESFSAFCRERAFIDDYKAKWADSPFPPTFVTTDAIVICLGHVLVIKRGRHPGKGLFALPGGFLDSKETIQNGCLRELKEETHLDLPYLQTYIKDQNVFDHPHRDPRGRMITHAFLFDLVNEKQLPAVKADDDASDLLWMPLQDLERSESLFFNDHAQIIRYFLNRMR